MFFLKVLFHVHTSIVSLTIIVLHFLADLIIMLVLPEFMLRMEAMELMERLHLDYQWITSLVAVGTLVSGLHVLLKVLFRNDPDCVEIPIVVLSAEAFIEQQEATLKLGIKDYLTKPIDFVKLSSILPHYLRQVDIPSKALPALSSLPESTRVQVLAGLEKLAHIPVVLLDKILENTQKIRELCDRFESIYLDLLQQIDHAAYNGDETQIANLVKKVFNDSNFSG